MFETMDKHVHGLGVDLRASATRTECSCLLVKTELRKFVAEQAQDVKDFIQFHGLTHHSTWEDEASKDPQKGPVADDFEIPVETATPKAGYARGLTHESPSLFSEDSHVALDGQSEAMVVYNPPEDVPPVNEELVDVVLVDTRKRRSTRTRMTSVNTRSPYTRSGRKRSKK